MARTSRDVWERRVENWARSGLTAKGYAAKIGVNANTLAHWKWQLGVEARASAQASPPAFVEVVASTIGQAQGHAPIELVHASGLRIRVPPDFDSATLRRVLDVIEGR